jgi:hypothetical protein
MVPGEGGRGPDSGVAKPKQASPSIRSPDDALVLRISSIKKVENVRCAQSCVRRAIAALRRKADAVEKKR